MVIPIILILQIETKMYELNFLFEFPILPTFKWPL